MDKRIIAALLCIALLSGCAADKAQPASTVINTAVTACESAEAAPSAEYTEPATEEPQESTVPEVTAEASSESAQPPEHTAEQTAEQSTEPQQSAEAPTEEPPQTTAATTVTTVETTTAATTPETTATTAQTTAEPEAVEIPEVMVPLSPGNATAENEKVCVDYSNADDGYISVRRTDDGEKRMKLRLLCGESTYDHDVSAGEVTQYYPLSCGSGEYTAQIYEQTEGTRYTKILELSLIADIKDETATFLYPNRYVDFSESSACVVKAARLCSGKSGTIERIAAIFGWVTDNVTYDKELAATVKSGYVPDPDSVLEKRTGICYDYASLMAAMLRSQGIPTRLVIGYAKENIYHAWNEIYTEETGWITPELYLSIHGYNITDATFYAGSSNKAKISEYISNSGNYSALYYY